MVRIAPNRLSAFGISLDNTILNAVDAFEVFNRGNYKLPSDPDSFALVVGEKLALLATSLFAMFRNSSTSEVILRLWKQAMTIPVHRTGTSCDVSYYRPSSRFVRFYRSVYLFVHGRSGFFN
ncbi:hypothetical protein Tcan_05903 [Toxocara canis]|uniref:Uncharacterized protein n=1 Tax=Toxocara canis TaxID=6265 RepID=A0A0B2VTS2_TOXCA|nr:hypothetical protein Tcan_05903 [Toxocara canis]